MLVWLGATDMAEWRKVSIPDPDGDQGWLLIPPDESAAKGPLWVEESFIDRIVYALNLAQTAEEVGIHIPMPEPQHYDIVFTPARKPRARSPRKK